MQGTWCWALWLHCPFFASNITDCHFQNNSHNSRKPLSIGVFEENEEVVDETNILEEINTELSEMMHDYIPEADIKEAFLYMRTTIAKFRKIVMYFHHSTKGNDKFKSLQEGKPNILVYDVCTRWNSTLLMISRLLELKQSIDNFFDYASTSAGRTEFSDLRIQQPSEEMWFDLKCFERVLKYFEEMTRILSAEKYPTASIIYPSICLLKNILQDGERFCNGLNKYCRKNYYELTLQCLKKLRTGIAILLDKRFSDFPSDLKYCALLDPRFIESEHLSMFMKMKQQRSFELKLK